MARDQQPPPAGDAVHRPQLAQVERVGPARRHQRPPERAPVRHRTVAHEAPHGTVRAARAPRRARRQEDLRPRVAPRGALRRLHREERGARAGQHQHGHVGHRAGGGRRPGRRGRPVPAQPHQVAAHERAGVEGRGECRRHARLRFGCGPVTLGGRRVPRPGEAGLLAGRGGVRRGADQARWQPAPDRRRAPVQAKQRGRVAAQRGDDGRGVLRARDDVSVADEERVEEPLARQRDRPAAPVGPEQRAPQRPACQARHEPCGVAGRVAREGRAASAAGVREHPRRGGRRVQVERVPPVSVHDVLQHHPVHVLGVAQQVALRDEASVAHAGERDALHPQLAPQQLDVLRDVGRAEQAAPLAEQRGARGRLAPGVGARGPLEVAAAKRAAPRAAHVEGHDVVAPHPERPLVRRLAGSRRAGTAPEENRRPAHRGLVGRVAAHSQAERAADGARVVQRYGEPRATIRSAGAEAQFRGSSGREQQERGCDGCRRQIAPAHHSTIIERAPAERKADNLPARRCSRRSSSPTAGRSPSA